MSDERPGLRKFSPLPENHDLVMEETSCMACRERFKVGDVVTLMPIGPGKDEEARKKCREGHSYNSQALPVHWACATGENGERLRLV